MCYISLPKARDEEKESELSVGKEREPEAYKSAEVEAELAYLFFRNCKNTE